MFIEYFDDSTLESPLLLIYGDDPAHFQTLRTVFRLLSENEQSFVDLHRLNGFVSLEDCELTARSATDDLGVLPRDPARHFDWVLSGERWSALADLIEPFCLALSSEGPLHQRLSEGEISVVLSSARGW